MSSKLTVSQSPKARASLALSKPKAGARCMASATTVDADEVLDVAVEHGRVEGAAAEVLRGGTGGLGEERQPAPRGGGVVVVLPRNLAAPPRQARS
jgi:hypothetical protein